MSDASEARSKAAKKNQKRKKAKSKQRFTLGRHSSETVSPEEVLTMLKQQLEQAKKDKDHARAGVLRDQVWVLTDLVAGVRTDIPDDELAPILDSIGQASKPEGAAEGAAPGITIEPPANPCAAGGAAYGEDRKLKQLRKKLKQIETLKEIQSKGEKLEANQLEKIEKENEIRAEIDEIETLLRELSLSSKP